MRLISFRPARWGYALISRTHWCLMATHLAWRCRYAKIMVRNGIFPVRMATFPIRFHIHGGERVISAVSAKFGHRHAETLFEEDFQIRFRPIAAALADIPHGQTGFAQQGADAIEAAELDLLEE